MMRRRNESHGVSVIPHDPRPLRLAPLCRCVSRHVGLAAAVRAFLVLQLQQCAAEIRGHVGAAIRKPTKILLFGLMSLAPKGCDAMPKSLSGKTAVVILVAVRRDCIQREVSRVLNPWVCSFSLRC